MVGKPLDNIDKEKSRDWEHNKTDIMSELLRLKSEQCPEFRQALLEDNPSVGRGYSRSLLGYMPISQRHGQLKARFLARQKHDRSTSDGATKHTEK